PAARADEEIEFLGDPLGELASGRDQALLVFGRIESLGQREDGLSPCGTQSPPSPIPVVSRSPLLIHVTAWRRIRAQWERPTVWWAAGLRRPMVSLAAGLRRPTAQVRPVRRLLVCRALPSPWPLPRREAAAVSFLDRGRCRPACRRRTSEVA